MLAAGFIMGLVAYWLKAGLSGVAADSTLFLSILVNPLMWLLAALSIAAFMLMQKALHGTHVSIVSPMIGGIAIVLPVILAYFFLGEAVSTAKWIGIILVLIGTAGLGK